jgi:hypothetical protein
MITMAKLLFESIRLFALTDKVNAAPGCCIQAAHGAAKQAKAPALPGLC